MNKKWNNPGASLDSCYRKFYESWKAMINRAGNKNGHFPTYSDVTVCERWLSYDNFFEDMIDTWKPGLLLDKDSIKPGNRIYCKEYCVWMSKEESAIEVLTRLGHITQRPTTNKSTILKGKTGRNHPKSKLIKCIETGEVFDSARIAEEKYHAPLNSVSHAANPKDSRKTAGKLSDGTKLHWEYL